MNIAGEQMYCLTTNGGADKNRGKRLTINTTHRTYERVSKGQLGRCKVTAPSFNF